jgi:hypothetical protein
MKSRTRNLLSLSKRKAQFFTLTAFAVVGALFVISRLLSPANIPDPSQVALAEEFFIFNDIKEKTIQVVKETKGCNEILKNLEEFREAARQFALRKGILYLEFRLNTPCIEDPLFPVVVIFDLRLVSPQVTLSAKYFVPWPA